MTTAFARLFDDAAMFPPGNAPVDVAVKAHLGRDSDLVGPLVCDLARVPAVIAEATEPLGIAVVGRVEDVVPALGLVAGSPVSVASAEILGPVRALAGLPVRPVAVEMPWGDGLGVPDDAVLKLRCGGDHVPTVDELAAAIRHCVEHDQPFKLTAGLHAAIAHDGAHGFVNVMAAVVAAMRGDDPAPVLTAAADRLDLASLGESRRLLRSIGTCDLDEPLAGLRGLGLIA
ncbi:hypothetical protein AFL01nite_22630 [Aeromicrobium flavum]|uniref:Uncharacterized protein n=1 Tax=Aeromicrobium flavum TaxID=416568 RepID=A0A512HWW2_9ACTN|nr:hypothetical protein [Aeromicrobium flavum]GEO89936.1 hypothetical protein AFL01nite_22630 [Aeromicrobium flavum]